MKSPQQTNMVKNTFGGNKHKGQARKDVGARQGSARLRHAKEDGEIYAVVTKMMGGILCNVTGIDKLERSCTIRGKFRGGKRRDNLIRPGTWILVGDRDWQSESKEKPVCDLLEVYADSDKERLKTQVVDVDWSIFNSAENTHGASAEAVSESVLFSDSIQEEYSNIMEKELNLCVSKRTTIALGDDETEIDINDI